MGPAEGDMAAKVFESIGKFGLALAVAGGVVNSALYNGEALGVVGHCPLPEDFHWSAQPT